MVHSTFFVNLPEKNIKKLKISKINLRKLTLRYAIVSSGRRVNGTRYKRAGWAALNISELTVAVSNPKK